MENLENLTESLIDQTSENEVEIIKRDLNDKYLRLYADFENWKRRSIKEREELVQSTKMNLLNQILDLENDISIASRNINDEGINIIINKLRNFLKSQGLEEVQTTSYDEDIHEVISVVELGEQKIIDVISKGWYLNGKIVKYPKIIISK